MTAFIATPVPAGSRSGNRVTALRWALRLRELGWRVRIAQAWNGEACDVLIALHALRSHDSIAEHARRCPGVPRIVALTGTDLYGDIHHDPSAQASLELANRIVVLQPLGIAQLPERLRSKTRTIRQSARAPREALSVVSQDRFAVVVLGHLRDVKDPLLSARATELLPVGSRITVIHLGAALDPSLAEQAREASRSSKGRWRWLGERPRSEAMRIVAGSDLLALTSVSEGGANVVTEAIACGVAVVSTRIDGSVGILGEAYPGYFEVHDAAGLADLLHRCESELAFLEELRHRTDALRPLVDPRLERESWRALLSEPFSRDHPSTLCR
ncbi:MAG: TIGR04348 family glycosyltransferase [Polyangiaceae bacterium]|nr:TIGR04348 family glycosyltransferase [Polyangiaceae bacterium]